MSRVAAVNPAAVAPVQAGAEDDAAVVVLNALRGVDVGDRDLAGTGREYELGPPAMAKAAAR
ncbi:hypothetical protein [Amycolatopsis sulphurea]|uniref:hypothetical protein n=1 Tax=Amycolatopsis sulphurea TaxID=76022 RepID=UPI001FEC600C|nr:hypothetical protein [Amycolatopsis sulphurea]